MLSRLSSLEYKIIEKLYLLGCDLHINEPLKKHTTIYIGGVVKAFVIPQTVDMFIKAVNMLEDHGIEYRIIGFGSNLLPDDEPLDFFVLSTERLSGFEFSEEKVVVESGLSLKRLIRLCSEKGLSGMEELYGIPGSVGGAIYMNAGAYGKEIKDTLLWVEILKNGQVQKFSTEELNFSYRNSGLKENEIILKACFNLKKDIPSKIQNRMYEYLKKRIEKQPVFEKSAGSLFKRPKPDFYVGSAIDELGLKGFKVGCMKISEKHAGFMINEGCGNFKDAMKLITIVKNSVKEKFGVELEPEVVIWK